MNDATIEVATPIVDDDEGELGDLTPDQLRVILHNHATCIGQLVQINNNLHDRVESLTQVLTAYTMQYPIDVEKLKAGDSSALSEPAEEDTRSHPGAYL